MKVGDRVGVVVDPNSTKYPWRLYIGYVFAVDLVSISVEVPLSYKLRVAISSEGYDWCRDTPASVEALRAARALGAAA